MRPERPNLRARPAAGWPGGAGSASGEFGTGLLQGQVFNSNSGVCKASLGWRFLHAASR